MESQRRVQAVLTLRALPVRRSTQVTAPTSTKYLIAMMMPMIARRFAESTPHRPVQHDVMERKMLPARFAGSALLIALGAALAALAAGCGGGSAGTGATNGP